LGRLNRGQFNSVLVILSVISLSVALPLAGIDIPFFRQVVGFVFVTFVPGYLILAILRAHRLNLTRTILFSVGLSLTDAMAVGFLANAVLPRMGIPQPMSLVPISVVSVGVALLLAVVAFLRNRSRDLPMEEREGLRLSLSPPVLFLLGLLPLAAVLGATLVGVQSNNAVLLILLPALGLVAFIVVVRKHTSTALLSLVVAAIALVLLLHQAFISNYLTGWDIHAENYWASLVIASGHWQSSLPDNLNAMLSVTALCPVYSIMLKLDSVWVFKVVYPIVFSLVPLALFETFREATGPKRAFLATFLFMAVSGFFNEMPSLARQEIAELYLALLALLVVDKTLKRSSRSVMILLFLPSLTVSHYGLTYLSLYLFFLGWLLLKLSRLPFLRRWYMALTRKSRSDSAYFSEELAQPPQPRLLNLYFLVYFLCFTIAWYSLVASGWPMGTLRYIGTSLLSHIPDFAFWNSREPLVGAAVGLDFSSVSQLAKVYRVIQYAVELSIVVGLAATCLRLRPLRLKFEYVAMSIGMSTILFACLFIPYFSTYLNASRVFQISFMMLSSFFVVGISEVWALLRQAFGKITGRAAPMRYAVVYYLTCLALLIPYYLFNTGLVFEVSGMKYAVGQIPTSIALSGYRLDLPRFTYSEAIAGGWVRLHSGQDAKVYGDELGRLLLQDYVFTRARSLSQGDSEDISSHAYLFLRAWNTQNNEFLLATESAAAVNYGHVPIQDSGELSAIVEDKALAYNSGKVRILAP
jgi:uncharacterized membrane protein